MEIDFFDFKITNLAETSAMLARCTGENAKKVMLIFQTIEQSADLKSFLSKIVTAAHLELDRDTCLLILKPGEQFSFIQLSQHFDIHTLIAFGIEPQQLGIHFQTVPYAILQHEQLRYVFADDLQQIFDERQQGGKRISGELWQTLKTLFLP